MATKLGEKGIKSEIIKEKNYKEKKIYKVKLYLIEKYRGPEKTWPIENAEEMIMPLFQYTSSNSNDILEV